MSLPPGGFFTFAILVAAVNYFTRDKSIKVRDFGEEDAAIIEDIRAQQAEQKAKAAAAAKAKAEAEKAAAAAKAAEPVKAETEEKGE